MANHYDVGDVVRLAGAFTVGGADADPTAVTLEVLDPSGNQSSYTWAAGQVVRQAAGRFYYDLAVDEAGLWRYRWEGTGAVVSAGEGHFYVRRSEFA